MKDPCGRHYGNVHIKCCNKYKENRGNNWGEGNKHIIKTRNEFITKLKLLFIRRRKITILYKKQLYKLWIQ